jgi:hypothetical protein
MQIEPSGFDAVLPSPEIQNAPLPETSMVLRTRMALLAVSAS